MEPLPGLGRRAERWEIEVGLIRGAVVKTRMWTAAIVEVEIPTDRASCLTDGFVGSQIHLLVFDALPQSLNEHVVPPCSFAIHADGDAVVGEHAGEGRASELRALVGVEDVRLAVARESILLCLDAEGRLHRNRQSPGQNTTRRPIEYSGEIDEAVGHRDIGDVHGPDLVRSRDLQVAQQIRIDLVAGFRLRRARPAIERLYPHPPHQRLHVPAADLAPPQGQQASQHTRAGEGVFQVQPIDLLHDLEIGGRYRAGQIIDASPADLQNLCLLGDRQIVLTVDHRFALSNPALVSAPSKKSFSSVSSPILAWSAFTSIAGMTGAPPPDPKTSEALPSSCDFHAVI